MRKQELDQLREEGLRRYRIIAPLLEEGLAESEKRSICRLIRSREGLSGRTLRRYVAAFKRGGFDTLLPRERKDKGSCKNCKCGTGNNDGRWGFQFGQYFIGAVRSK